MTFEKEINRLNEDFFFKEFTYSATTFRPHPSKELELADGLVWLDEMLVVFQLKERRPMTPTSSEVEEKWFKKKIQSLATRQIRDSLHYLYDNKLIRLKNHRGDNFVLEMDSISSVHKVVCYHNPDLPTRQGFPRKFHQSSTAGTIHIVSSRDYLGIVRTVLTPHELSEFLSFREHLIERWGESVNVISEPALMGQYLAGDSSARPSPDYITVLEALEHNTETWDLSGIIKLFPDRVMNEEDATVDYYSIVTELAKLKRNELKEFKTRFQISMDKCRSNAFALPYRMATPRTNCAFVFVPLTNDMLEHRQQALVNLTNACRYDLKMSKCLGASFSPDSKGWFLVEWCYLEAPWRYDREMDAALKHNNPFRKVETVELDRYRFSNDGQGMR